jgi:DNA-binding CsgD family transcriptional regulator
MSQRQRKYGGRRLTDRQTAILELVASGMANKEIAFELGISEQAVKEHVSTLLHHLGAANRAALGEAAATRRFVGAFSIDPEWLRFLFQEAPLPIAVVAGPEHSVVAFNKAFELMAGGREILGRRFADVVPAASALRMRLDEVYSSGRRSLGDVILEPLPAPDGTTSGVVIFGLTPRPA